MVDDDELIRARLALLLAQSHYEVATAASGREAVRLLGSMHHHVVLTDWQMPDMDGVTLCRHVRSVATAGYTFILMLTVRGDREDVLQGLAAGADEYLVKGATFDEILARIEVGRRIMRAGRHEEDSHTVFHPSRAPSPRADAERRWASIQPRAVIRCDVSEIKAIAARLGNDVGRQLLTELLSRMQACIRQDRDRISPVGEEGLLIILPDTSIGEADRLTRKLRHVIAVHPVMTRAGIFNLSTLIGVNGAVMQEPICRLS